MRDSKKRKGKGRNVFSILVDGDTEKWYLEKLRASENPEKITIKPDLPQKKALKDQFASVLENAKIYAVSIWIIDLDVVILENRITELKGYMNIARNKENIHILVNTPCLEFWFLQHVKDSGKYFDTGDQVIVEIRKNPLVKDYTKSKNYFLESTPNIYDRLRPRLSLAIENAAKRGNFDPDEPKKGIAEIYRIFEIMGIQLD